MPLTERGPFEFTMPLRTHACELHPGHLPESDHGSRSTAAASELSDFKDGLRAASINPAAAEKQKVGLSCAYY